MVWLFQFFSSPRATKDIDIIVIINRDEIISFYGGLKFIKGYNLPKHHRGKKLDYIKDLIEVPLGNTWADIIVAPGEFEEKAVNESLVITIFNDLRIKIVRPEFLLILKLISASEQDYIDCAQLWNAKINRRVVRKLAEEAHITTALRRVINLAKNIKS